MTSTINILNVLDANPLDLAMWINANVMNVRLPVPGPNYTINVETEILPVLATIANHEALITELYILVVGATPTMTAVRTQKDGDIKATAESLNRKKDILKTALSTLENLRETASRLMTGMQQSKIQFG